MRTLEVRTANGAVLVERCRVAYGPLARAWGLLGRARLERGEGLLLPRTRAITMLGMRFAIDAVALRRDGTVVACWPHLAPWHPVVAARETDQVLELPDGTLERAGVRCGDRLVVDAVGG